MSKHKKTICLDFDGVINSYTSGWKGPRCIPDKPVPYVFQWIETFIIMHCTPPESVCLAENEGEYELCIYSSRSRYWFAKRAMKKWMIEHGFDKRFFEVIKFPSKKPPAYLTIDDRAFCFNGQMPRFNDIFSFVPWNKRPHTKNAI